MEMVRRLVLAALVVPIGARAEEVRGPRMNPDDQMRFFWYLDEHYYDRVVAAGFNTLITGFGSYWYRNTPEQKQPSLVRRRKYIERMARDGIDHIEQVKISFDDRLIRIYPQLKRDGMPNLRSFDLSNGALQKELDGLFSDAADALKGLDAVIGVQPSTEVRDGSRPSYTEGYAAKCERELGFKPPPELSGSQAGHYSRFKDFPVSRVVTPDYKPLRYYVWFWKRGDGWNEYQDRCAAIFKERLGRDLVTLFDPITRCPPLWGYGGSVTYGNQWYYEEPQPYGVAYVISEQMAMARGTPGQRVVTMLQGICSRGQFAPRKQSVSPEPAWVSDRPNATYITQPPDIIRETLWMAMSRKIDGIGLYAWNVFFDAADKRVYGDWKPKDAKAYQMTNPKTFEVVEETFKSATVPLGPLLKAIPEREPEVALLESYASSILAGVGGAWGRGYRWGDLATAANLQPHVLFEEDIARDGIPRSVKVLLLPDCPVLTKASYEAALAFQAKGGVIVADELLVPGILPDLELPDYLLSRYDRAFHCADDGEAIRRGVVDLRSDLKALCGYEPYADSDNPYIIVHARTYGNSDYVFAVNDKRTFGDYLGQWKRLEEKGCPNEGTVMVKRAAGAVYDLVNHRAVPFEVRDGVTRIPVKYATSDGRILMVSPRKLQRLSVSVANGFVTVTSPDKDAMIPIAVSADGQKTRYGVVENGIWRRKYPVGRGLKVKNLADGGEFADWAAYTEYVHPEPVDLPELMVSAKGERIETKEAWENIRRPELIDFFSRNVYGVRPVDKPEGLRFDPIEADKFMPEIPANRKRVRISFRGSRDRWNFTACAFLPTNAVPNSPVPAFLLISNRDLATAANLDRAVKSEFFPVEEIIRRGYAAIVFKNTELAPDEGYLPFHKGDGEVVVQEPMFTNGIYACWNEARTENSWGAISVWAWGASRVLDWLETVPEVDATKVAVVGHSRGGKTSLWAGATDTRFAMVCVNDSGCCGAKLNHAAVPNSETIQLDVLCNPHWFCKAFRQYAGRDFILPYDQHWVAALVAPRLLCIASASDDYGAGPWGEFLTARHASPAWELYGKKGLAENHPYAVERPYQDGAVSYHLRQGRHNLTLYDWERYMDFADRHGWKL